MGAQATSLTWISAGGSFEMAYGTDELPPEYATSVPLGASRLTRDWLHDDPPSAKSVKELRRYIRSTLKPVVRDFHELGRANLVAGTSKTFRSLARIAGAAPSAAGPYVKRELHAADLGGLWAQRISAMTVEDRLYLPGVSDARARQLLAGALVAEAALELFEFPKMEICPWALREGLILRRLDQLVFEEALDPAPHVGKRKKDKSKKKAAKEAAKAPDKEEPHPGFKEFPVPVNTPSPPSPIPAPPWQAGWPPEMSNDVEPEVNDRQIPVALSSASVYPLSVHDAFAVAQDLGYEGVEVMVTNNAVSQNPDALIQLSHRYHQEIVSIHAPTLLLTQQVWGGTAWNKIEKSCQMAADVGCDTVVVHPPFRWQSNYAENFVEGVREIAARYRVRIAVENMYHGAFADVKRWPTCRTGILWARITTTSRGTSPMPPLPGGPTAWKPSKRSETSSGMSISPTVRVPARTSTWCRAPERSSAPMLCSIWQPRVSMAS